jgi:hypothetical protein
MWVESCYGFEADIKSIPTDSEHRANKSNSTLWGYFVRYPSTIDLTMYCNFFGHDRLSKFWIKHFECKKYLLM